MKFEKLSDAKFASAQIDANEVNKIKGGRVSMCGAKAGRYYDTAEEICKNPQGGDQYDNPY
jgi:hypothetical protein